MQKNDFFTGLPQFFQKFKLNRKEFKVCFVSGTFAVADIAVFALDKGRDAQAQNDQIRVIGGGNRFGKAVSVLGTAFGFWRKKFDILSSRLFCTPQPQNGQINFCEKRTRKTIV